MKFQVRDGFVLQFTLYQDDGTGGKMAVPIVKPGGSPVDLNEDQAGANLHMLEPVGKDAVAFCEARHVPAPPVAAAPAADVQAVAAAVIATLQAAGLVVKAGAPGA